MSDLPQQVPINQFVGDGVTTIYPYNFLILESDSNVNDIAVYVTPPGQAANPSADLQVLNTAYTVSGVGVTNGGFVTFQAGFIPVSGAIVTLARNMQFTIDTEFAQVQNFNGANLDLAFERVVLLLQQVNAFQTERSLSYYIDTYLPNVNSVNLPLLTNINNQVWISQGGVIIAALLQNTSLSTLQAQLASEVMGGDGTTIIGYYNLITNTPGTLNAFLNAINTTVTNLASESAISANPNLVIGGDFGTNPWQRGTSFPAITTGSYSADRFSWTQSGAGVVTVSQDTANFPSLALTGFVNTAALKVLVTTAALTINTNDFYAKRYVVEGYDFVRIAQKAFTISFAVYATVPGLYNLSLTNSAGDRGYAASFTVAAANTWQEVVLNIPASPSAGTWLYNNGIGLDLRFVLASGSNYIVAPNTWVTGAGNLIYSTATQVNGMSAVNNVFEIQALKIEVGSNKTPFPVENIQTVLAKCQRYFYKTFDQGVAPAQGIGSYNGAAAYTIVVNGANPDIVRVSFPVKMRIAPSFIYYNPINANANWYNFSISTDSGAATDRFTGMQSTNTRNAQVSGDGSGGLVAIHLTANADF